MYTTNMWYCLRSKFEKNKNKTDWTKDHWPNFFHFISFSVLHIFKFILFFFPSSFGLLKIARSSLKAINACVCIVFCKETIIHDQSIDNFHIMCIIMKEMQFEKEVAMHVKIVILIWMHYNVNSSRHRQCAATTLCVHSQACLNNLISI